jgi:hypothetical protein
VDEPTRGEGHEDHAGEEDDGGAQLQTDGGHPGAFALLTEGGAAPVVCAAGGRISLVGCFQWGFKLRDTG